MKNEKEKMLAGELYNGSDKQLVEERVRARAVCRELNRLCPDADKETFAALVEQLLGSAEHPYITPPFYCDYGSNIFLGKNVYFNFNCVVLDVAKVTIGDNVLFGPGVQLLTASHPMDSKTRNSGLELGKPITIGNKAWLGGGVIVCPGVSIGADSVIGAGSVVTRSIPERVFAAGNPCRVVKALE